MKRALVPALLALAASTAIATDPPKLAFTLSKETTSITSPLKPDGTPDYVAAINEKYGKGVTPENNAAVAYLQAVGTRSILGKEEHDKTLQLMGISASPEAGVFLQRLNNEVRDPNDEDNEKMYQFLLEELPAASRSLWNPNEHPKLAALLQRKEKVLDQIVAGMDRPKWCMPTVSRNGTLASASYPYSGHYRDAAQLLAARATGRAAAGDFEGFSRDALAVKRFGRHLASAAGTEARLIGFIVDNSGNQALGAAIGSGRLSAAQCRTLVERLNSLPPMPPLREGADDYDRWAQLETLGAVTKGDGKELFLTMARFTEMLPGIFASDDKEPEPLSPAEVETLRVTRQAAEISFGEVDWNVVLTLANETQDRALRAMSAESMRAKRDERKAFEEMLASWKSEGFAKGTGRQPGESREEYSARVGKVMIAILRPQPVAAEEYWQQSEFNHRNLNLLLLTAEVKAQTGQWPASLNDLVPAKIKELPLDLYPIDNPGPLRYLVTPAGATITSSLGGGTRLQVGVYLKPPPATSP